MTDKYFLEYRDIECELENIEDLLHAINFVIDRDGSAHANYVKEKAALIKTYAIGLVNICDNVLEGEEE